MPDLSRRKLLGLGAAFPALRSLEAAVKPVRIRDVDIFAIRIPITRAESEAGLYNSYGVVKVVTDAGVTGYSFAGPPSRELPVVKQLLAGKDLFAVDRHLREGLGRFGGVEHAVWDAIGKIAGQPVYRLLGGASDRVRAYITCVWKGNADQSQVPYRDQVEQALRVRKAGFHGMKIRAWRPDPMGDVEVAREIMAATGKGFHLMFDRTAHAPVDMAGQKIWDFETGLKVARGLQAAGAYWLEEPFARDDYETPARLAAAVDLLITGGEGYTSLEPFRQCLLRRTYDVVQPDGRNAGGIFMCRKTAMLAESFHVPCILHGTMSLMLAGWLQATLAIGCPWQEVALVTPPLLPAEQWEPALKVLRGKTLFDVRDGYLLAPPHPGLGLDIDEDAIEKYRVKS